MVSSTLNLYPVLLCCIGAVFAVGAVLMARPAISDRAADRFALCFLVLAGVAVAVAVAATLFPIGGA